MISAPWYLLAGGIVLVIIAYFLAGFSGAAEKRGPMIDERMSDKDIAQSLQDSESLSPASIVMLLGFVLIAISVIWRFVRYFV
ncbi:hypothetical protein [Thalassoroseus pseudoceratinae]|uniref:hypothetical protein n=1 Tax=Thalassoroseus pseudoceratinae TaxID=2713176 RepID=UPI001423F9C7|nr:hypothetical protein [Thalassoroseus pseudoceratinae]